MKSGECACTHHFPRVSFAHTQFLRLSRSRYVRARTYSGAFRMRCAIRSTGLAILVVFCGSAGVSAQEFPEISAARNTPLVQMIQRVRPAVVSLLVRSERGYGSGSGTIIHPRGYVLTNHHVIKNRSGLALVEGRRVLRYNPCLLYTSPSPRDS